MLLGLRFGLAIYMNLKKLPVHRAMREISELIYETCKTYLITQGKFILILEAFIAIIIILYFGVLSRYGAAPRRLFSLLVWLVSPAVMASPGLEFGLTPLPIRVLHLPVSKANLFRFTQFRSKPA